MKIAFVTSVFPVPWDLTRGRPVYETARALSRIAEVKVHVVMARYARFRWLQPRGYPDGRLPPGYALPDVDMHVDGYPALPAVSRPINGLVSGFVLQRLLAADAYDLVLAYWIYPEGYGAIRAARRLGLPCVLGARGSDLRVRDRISAYWTRTAIGAADHLLTVSEDLRKRAVDKYGADPARVTTVVNGCNTSLFHRRDRAHSRHLLGVAPEWEVVLFVGRVVQAKGVFDLLAAFASLCRQRQQARLIFVGDGVDMPRLRSKVAGLGLSDVVRFAGGVSPESVASWMTASDCLCLPSYSEGYPNVLVEALACGVPVVATDVGGAREIVDETCGRLVAVADAAALREALAAVLDGDWNRDGLSSRFGRSWDDVARSTLEVCRQVILRVQAGSPSTDR